MKTPKTDEKAVKNEIELPEEFEIPSGDGETFEAVAEIKKDEDGRYCVVSLDGIPLPDGEDDPNDEDADESLGAGAKEMAKGGY